MGIRSITKEGREQGKRFGVEQYEMRMFSKDRDILENLVSSLFFIFYFYDGLSMNVKKLDGTLFLFLLLY